MEPSVSSPASLTVHVCFPGARAAVMDNLNRQREEGRLCDLSIQVQGQVFRAHRCVLAASSPYFHDQVLLKNVTTVSLPSVMDPVAFESVLSSAYTGQLSLVHDDIVNYVTVASFLQMWHIVDKCTEILKRPRPSVEVGAGEGAGGPPGTASRQQSPSSTDCLYLETESRKKERKPDALPPLATWRRPQQFPRWGRPRPPSAQQIADSQLDTQPGFLSGDFTSCEEVWEPAPTKSYQFAQDPNRHRAGVSGSEPGKHRARFPQRGGLTGADRESGDGDETQERRKDERRETEADEGVGEEEDVAAKKESFSETRLCGFHPALGPGPVLGPGPGPAPGPAPGPGPGPGPGQALGKGPPEDFKEKVQRDSLVSETPSELAGDPREEGVPGRSCPVSGRPQWQMGPWAQQDGDGVLCKGMDADQQQDQVDFFAEASFSRDTYDEIEDGTGQVSQRPLVPPSPDFTIAASEVNWTSSCPGQSSSLSFSSHRQASSPPTPSSSSTVSLAGAPYTGKVHFCHCGKAYTLKSMRDRHVKMQHLNLRPFGCPVCTKSFKMKHHLTKHLKTHGGLRPYECGLCGKKVIWRDSFLRHQARCERLASSSATSNNTGSANAAELEDGYAFEDGPALMSVQGQVKVEDVDFNRDMEDGMSGLLGSVSGIVEQLRTQPEPGGQVFKEEASDGFSGNDSGGAG
ncbi:zinc finger and BTB domain-containing protein 22 [Takifugu flavidus]|uniref:zinc finger and BTB domain-containing protein 22 n=1 Tax=Takifugu flavidus TaxID=433684 RepID=UPI0025447A07|nr:zinc finger and BTB domain-containing protein 22 [Takifugu flavidus]